ncbi:MAG: L,D-transpeptidase [Fusobacteriaceae bacterium]|jgi:lipoprotein-anchoring transpeptidase ErfK/SrfK|nr:L,D-transpeptidase [Fusobacteriaceae bacterium]
MNARKLIIPAVLLLFAAVASGRGKRLTEKEYYSPYYFSPGKLHNELVRRGWFVEETYFLPPSKEHPEGVEIPLDDYALNETNAIKRAEAWLNIPVIGRQSADIWYKLAARPKPVDILSDAAPMGYFIVINKTLLSATLYKDREVIKKMPVAIGRDPNATPTGRWYVATKFVNPAWGGNGDEPMTSSDPNNPLGEYWMGISYLNRKGQHSIGIHGTSRFRKGTFTPGTLASSGCMRLINSEAKWLFEQVPMKTPVWIGYADELREWGVEQKEKTDYQ